MPPVARIVASNGLSNHRPSKFPGYRITYDLSHLNTVIKGRNHVLCPTPCIKSVLEKGVTCGIMSLAADKSTGDNYGYQVPKLAGLLERATFTRHQYKKFRP
jgi:hypothetical protein